MLAVIGLFYPTMSRKFADPPGGMEAATDVYRSCGFYLQSEKLTGSWGSYFAGNSWERCDSTHNITFGCTKIPTAAQRGSQYSLELIVPLMK